MLKMILLNNTLVGNMTGMTGMARVWMHVVSLIRHHDTLNKIKKINTKNYFHIQYQPGYFGAVALLGDGLLFYAPTYDLSNCNFIL